MGLQNDIGYVEPRANTIQRAAQRLVSHPSLSPTLTRLADRVDRVLLRVSRGKVSASNTIVAFPTIVLITTGARSGETRETPLVAVPIGDDLAVVGSNGGSGGIPGWVHNLRAHPGASVSYGQRQADVVARELEDSQHDEVFAAAARIYPGFAGYRERADYKIPVFVLARASDADEREEQS